VNTPEQAVGLDYPPAEGLAVARVGTSEQAVLVRRGDDVRIDWGYGYLATPAGAGTVVAGGNGGRMRRAFVSNGTAPVPAGPIPASPVSQSRLAMAATWDLGVVGAEPVTRWMMLAYDDVMAIRYFAKDLRAYWRRNGATIESVLVTAAREREQLDRQARAFDEELAQDLTRVGGPSTRRLVRWRIGRRWPRPNWPQTRTVSRCCSRRRTSATGASGPWM